MNQTISEFNDTDIVASDIIGIIAEYSSIKNYYMDDDSFRLATIDEQFQRNDAPNESKLK